MPARQPMSDLPDDPVRLTTEELVELSMLAAQMQDPVLATHCWLVAKRRRKKSRDAILHPLIRAGLQPIDWWEQALQASQRIRKTTGGNHHLYVVLLDGYAAGSRYGLYVGESRYTPERRFENHKSGKHASRHVQRKGVRLLPELYRHLNPLSRAEAKALEPQLAAVFREMGIRTEGGH